MKLKTKLTALALAVGFTTSAFGQTLIFEEDFGTLANGTTITTSNTDLTYVRVGGQGGSIEALNPSTVGSGASLFLTGPSGGSINGFGVADGLDFTGQDEITFSFDFKLSNADGTFVFGLGSGNSFTGNGNFTRNQGLVWYQIDEGTLQRSTSTTWSSANTLALTVGTAYTFTSVIDLINERQTYSINGDVIASNAILTTASVTPDAFRMYSVDGSNIEVDNISLTAIPEPQYYAALFGLLAIGFAIYRRRQS